MDVVAMNYQLLRDERDRALAAAKELRAELRAKHPPQFEAHDPAFCTGCALLAATAWLEDR